MWWFVAIFVVALVIAYAMAPKPQSTTAKPSGLEDVTAPTAEDGREIPVLFGSRIITGPNCCWYGDLRVEPIVK